VKQVLSSFNKPGRITIAGAPSGQDARIIADLAVLGRDVLWVARDDVAAATMDEA
jgi:hypothetical protein